MARGVASFGACCGVARANRHNTTSNSEKQARVNRFTLRAFRAAYVPVSLAFMACGLNVLAGACWLLWLVAWLVVWCGVSFEDANSQHENEQQPQTGLNREHFAAMGKESQQPTGGHVNRFKSLRKCLLVARGVSIFQHARNRRERAQSNTSRNTAQLRKLSACQV